MIGLSVMCKKKVKKPLKLNHCWYKRSKSVHVTFSAAFVQPVGEQFRRELPGHLIQPHGPTDFQLLWSEEDTRWTCAEGGGL